MLSSPTNIALSALKAGRDPQVLVNTQQRHRTGPQDRNRLLLAFLESPKLGHEIALLWLS